MILGNLEDFTAESVRGWLLDPTSPDDGFNIRVRINGVVRAEYATKQTREDIAKHFGHVGHGFDFQIGHLLDQAEARVKLETVGVNFEFGNSERLFLNGQPETSVRQEVLRNPDIYLFPSDLMSSVEGKVPVTSEPARREMDELIASTQFIFVLFTNRSGSNLVTDMLERMGFGAGTTNEPFLADTILSVVQENSLASVEDYLAATISFWRRNGVFFAKIGWDALFWLSSCGLITNIIPKSTFIFVRRRDKILQAISYLKASRSGEFFRWVDGPDDGGGSPIQQSGAFWQQPQTASVLASIVHNFFVAESRLEYFLTLHGLEAYEIWYEDMSDRLPEEYARMARFLGPVLGKSPASDEYTPRLKRQASGNEFAIKSTFLRIMMSKPT